MEKREMRGKNENNSYTDTALAIALLVQNILIIALLCAIVWFFHDAVPQFSPLGGITRGGILE